MSLTFGALASDKVTFGSNLDQIATCTWCLWVYPTTITTGRRMFSKIAASGGTGQMSLFIPVGTNRVRAFADYDGTDASAVSADNTISTNSWQFFAVSFNTNAPKIYKGSLTSPASEISYASQAAPTGNRVSDSFGNVYVGGDDTSTDAFQGSIYSLNWVVGVTLTLGQIQEQQFAPAMDPHSKLLAFLGDNGTGTQPDFSGNGHNGTVTGATQSDNPPLRRRAAWYQRARYRRLLVPWPLLYDSGHMAA